MVFLTIDNFRPWTMLNEELKILVKILAIDIEVALFNLDQFKAFDRFDHRFLEAALSASDLEPYFRTWFRLLYASLRWAGRSEFVLQVSIQV